MATPQGYELQPVLTYYNEYFFNSSYVPKITADLKLDFSTFNMTQVIEKIQDVITQATGFDIDFEFPSLPATGSVSHTPSKLGNILGDLQGRFDFLDSVKIFQSMRGEIFSRYRWLAYYLRYFLLTFMLYLEVITVDW